TKGADTLGDRLALPSETLGLLAGGSHVLCNLFQARCHFGGTPWTTLITRAVAVVVGLLDPLEPLFGLRHSLGSSTLVGGQWCRDRLAQLMLHMEEVRRVMHPEVVFDIRQQARGLITG